MPSLQQRPHPGTCARTLAMGAGSRCTDGELAPDEHAGNRRLRTATESTICADRHQRCLGGRRRGNADPFAGRQPHRLGVARGGEQVGGIVRFAAASLLRQTPRRATSLATAPDRGGARVVDLLFVGEKKLEGGGVGGLHDLGTHRWSPGGTASARTATCGCGTQVVTPRTGPGRRGEPMANSPCVRYEAERDGTRRPVADELSARGSPYGDVADRCRQAHATGDGPRCSWRSGRGASGGG
jgi:hypothetical protein